MNELSALIQMAQNDDDLRAELAAATTAEEISKIARDRGVGLQAGGIADDAELSDAELESVSGGTILHPTMSVFCGTNGNFCTFNPYACQAPG